MPLYNKPAKSLVYDLINEANPTLPIALTPANTKLSDPSTATVAGNAAMNTAITCIAASPDYIGRKVLNYRRISLNNLFRGITVQINKYSPNQNAGSSGSVVFTLYNLLPIINSVYGLNLGEDDVTNVNITRGTVQENGFYTNTVTVTAKATSFGYIGTFAFKWRGAPQELESMITVTDLAARSFPGGNTFDGAHPTVVDNMAYGIDWTSFIAIAPWGNFPANPVAGGETPAFGYRFLAELQRLYGKNLVDPTNPAPAYVFQSWGGVVYDLNTQAGRDAVPLANSTYYNRVLVWTIPAADTAKGCGIGKHYIHFNV